MNTILIEISNNPISIKDVKTGHIFYFQLGDCLTLTLNESDHERIVVEPFDERWHASLMPRGTGFSAEKEQLFYEKALEFLDAIEAKPKRLTNALRGFRKTLYRRR